MALAEVDADVVLAVATGYKHRLPRSLGFEPGLRGWVAVSGADHGGVRDAVLDDRLDPAPPRSPAPQPGPSWPEPLLLGPSRPDRAAAPGGTAQPTDTLVEVEGLLVEVRTTTSSAVLAAARSDADLRIDPTNSVALVVNVLSRSTRDDGGPPSR